LKSARIRVLSMADNKRKFCTKGTLSKERSKQIKVRALTGIVVGDCGAQRL